MKSLEPVRKLGRACYSVRKAISEGENPEDVIKAMFSLANLDTPRDPGAWIDYQMAESEGDWEYSFSEAVTALGDAWYAFRHKECPIAKAEVLDILEKLGKQILDYSNQIETQQLQLEAEEDEYADMAGEEKIKSSYSLSD